MSVSSLLACGRSPSRAIDEGNVGAASDVLELKETPCDEKTCNVVELYVDGPNGTDDVLAQAGVDNDWGFVAEAGDAPSRKVIMKIYSGPKACKGNWFGQNTNEVSCSFKPPAPAKGGKLIAIMRDVSLCIHKFPNLVDSCGDLGKEISGFADITKEFNWSIGKKLSKTNANISPEFTQNAPKAGANGGIKGCGMGMLQGLTGIISGNFLPAVTGCINGHFDGNKQISPGNSTGQQDPNNGSLLSQF